MARKCNNSSRNVHAGSCVDLALKRIALLLSVHSLRFVKFYLHRVPSGSYLVYETRLFERLPLLVVMCVRDLARNHTNHTKMAEEMVRPAEIG